VVDQDRDVGLVLVVLEESGRRGRRGAPREGMAGQEVEGPERLGGAAALRRRRGFGRAGRVGARTGARGAREGQDQAERTRAAHPTILRDGFSC
jgi:hypothetical protein